MFVIRKGSASEDVHIRQTNDGDLINVRQFTINSRDPTTSEIFQGFNFSVIYMINGLVIEGVKPYLHEVNLNNHCTNCNFFLSDLNTFLLVAYIIGLILFLVTSIKYILYIPNILRDTPKRFVSRTYLLCGIYTIVAGSALTSMLVPRALLFCESLSVITFTLCSYQFFWYMLI